MDVTKATGWAAFSLDDVQFVSLRARGKDGAGSPIQITYDRGTVLVTDNVDGSSPSTRVLGLQETRSLLEALRIQARAFPRSKSADPAALRALVGALARIVNSPGPVPFGLASFGPVTQDPTGVVGQIVVDAVATTAIRDANGELWLERSRKEATGLFRRQLTIEQLRALIAALRARAASAAQLDPLWVKVMEDAMQREASLTTALAAARGTQRQPGSKTAGGTAR